MTLEQHSNRTVNIEALEEAANKLKKTLSARSEVLRLSWEQNEYNWQHVRVALKPEEAAVELVHYRVFEKKWTKTVHYAVIIIKPDSKQPEIFFLENGNTLEEEIIILYRNFMYETGNNPIAQRDAATCKLLYTQLWEPIAARLKNEKKIYFSPDGIYHFINPATLQDAAGKWLDERWNITQVTSLQDIIEKEAPQDTTLHPPVLVGYPDYTLDNEAREALVKKQFSDHTEPDYQYITYRDGSALQPLPGTREEVKEIAGLYRKKGETPVVWLGDTALEENIKRVDNPRVLHLATHAFFQVDIDIQKEKLFMGMDKDRMLEDPLLRSGLFFSGAGCTLNDQEVPGDLENGILTAREAVDLRLDTTKLVVLSACTQDWARSELGRVCMGCSEHSW